MQRSNSQQACQSSEVTRKKQKISYFLEDRIVSDIRRECARERGRVTAAEVYCMTAKKGEG